jgi:hypothetical protein
MTKVETLIPKSQNLIPIVNVYSTVDLVDLSHSINRVPTCPGKPGKLQIYSWNFTKSANDTPWLLTFR